MDQLPRALRGITSQEVARVNAATAAGELKRRRLEHEDVEDYLARRWGYGSAVDAAPDITSPPSPWSGPGSGRRHA